MADARPLSILHLNINSVQNKTHLLEYYLNTLNPQIFLLNETKLDPFRPFQINNYQIIRNDFTRRKWGVAIGIKNNISFTQNFCTDGEDQILSIQIKNSQNNHLNIISYYNPPGNCVNKNILKKWVKNSIIIGDLNCPNTEIGCNRTSTPGRDLVDFLEANDLYLQNTGMKSRRNPIDQTEELLDLVITTPDINHLYLDTKVFEESNLSDHYIIVASINFPLGKIKSNIITYYNPNRADWGLFQSLNSTSFGPLGDQLGEIIPSMDSLDKVANSISSTIRSNFEKSCPIQTRRERAWALNSHLHILIKAKRKLRRVYIKNRDFQIKQKINRLHYEIKREIRVQKSKTWENISNGLNKETDPRRFWKRVNNALGKNSNKPQDCIQLKTPNGDFISDPQDQVDLLADTFEDIFQIPQHPKFSNENLDRVDNIIKQNSELFQPNFLNNINPNNGPEINAEDFVKALNKSHPRSTPGDDRVTYLQIKHLPANAVTVIIFFFNLLLQVGYFPSPWKLARTIVLPKPGKNLFDPKNYRPISLLSCLGKLFEKIVAKKMQDILHSNKFFNNSQYGFRLDKGTFSALLRLTDNVQMGFQRKQVTTAIFLDAEKAFDQTWQNGLKYKLKNSGLGTKYTRLIASFLDGRQMYIARAGHNSRVFGLKAGTPQGAVLSPLLYIIYVNDIPSYPNSSVKVSQFADDIALWAASSNSNWNIRHIQNYLNKFETWCGLWRIKINPIKSNLIHFNKNPRKQVSNLNSVILFGSQIPIVNQAKFLGVTFDNKLNFKAHIDDLITRTRYPLLSLKRLSYKAKLSPALGFQIFSALIRSIWEYGSVTFISASQTDLYKLERVHLQALRAILRIPSFVPNSETYPSLGTTPLGIRFRLLNQRLANKFIPHDPNILHLARKILHNNPLNNYRTSLGSLFPGDELEGALLAWEGDAG